MGATSLRQIFVLLIGMLTLTFAAATQALDIQNTPQDRPPLRVVLDDNYPPYVFRNDLGDIDGFLPDIWRLWAQKTGVRVEIIATDWAKALSLMESGEADVIDTIFRTPARDAKYDFTQPYADIPVSIYAHADLGPITDLAGLHGLVIGVKEGDTCVDRLHAAGLTAQASFDGYQHLVEAALAGQVRAFCLDNPPANFLLYRAGAVSTFRQAFQLYGGAFHRAVRKGDAATLALVERGFAAVSAEEENALSDKWTGRSDGDVGRYLLRAVAVAAGLAGLALAAAAAAGVAVSFLRREVARRTAELRAEKIRLRTLLDTLPDLVWLKDADGVYLACNAEFGKFFGAAESDIVGRTDYDFIPGDLADFFRENDRLAVAKDGPSVNEEEVTYVSDGRRVLLETIKTPMRDADGRLVGVLGIGRDITERRRQDQRLKLAARVFDCTADAIVIADGDEHIVAVNRAFTAVTGYTESDVRGKRLRELPGSGRHAPDFFAGMAATVVRDGIWRGELWSRRKNGEIFPEWRTTGAVADEQGQVLHYVSVFSDITPIKRSQEALDYLAYHDTLTGLPNRAYVMKRLAGVPARARAAAGGSAVLFVDLDGFKHVNDSLGHQVGDGLLRAVADAVRRRIPDADAVARLGGDEFVIILEQIAGADAAAAVAADVNDLFRRPFTVADRELYVTASIGVALFPDHGDDGDTLLKHADLALYAAKSGGRNTFRFFEPAMGERATQRQRLENALRGAVRRGELFLAYQPQIRLSDGVAVGVEALARWRSPEFGLVPPDQFIPVAEENGAILEIGAWVLREACRQTAAWRRAGVVVPRMAVNLSARQIRHGSVAELTAAACRDFDVDPACIELEVTESMAMEQTTADDDDLRNLCAGGVSLSIDDFGAGHSSLSRLRRLPVQKLKIDRSFVCDIGRDRDDEAIVVAIITLGRSLGLCVVAEGVETQMQADFLRRAGCDLAQGYLYARPAPPEDIPALFAPRPAATAAALFEI